ncbi:MAG: ribose-phosphate pyrophosphokinase [Chlamydiia bacterium]|nr:ribose-phosphate pyrophosphokinase [Chlamydiia bacterium]
MNEDFSNVHLFSGSSHPELTAEIAKNLSLTLGDRKIKKFPDGETFVQIMDNVRGRDTYVVQSVALDPNEYLMELLILVDALKRASARSIVTILPYYGYCRQDRKDGPRVPITAKLVANMLVTAGATRVVTMDLHAEQLQGFFDIPVDHLYAWPLMAEALTGVDTKQLVVVSPDIGSVKLGRAYANALGVELAIVDKTRLSPDRVEMATLIGDVKGKDVLLADDMCSTAGTLVSAAEACQKKGARKIVAAITHGLFVGEALKRIEKSPIELVYVSNTIPMTKGLLASPKFVSVSVASMFSRAISCIHSKESISSLFVCK